MSAPTATMPTVEELTRHLWRGGKFAHWWGLSESGTKRSHWFEADKPEPLSATWDKWHHYFSVNPGTVKGSEGQRVTNATVAAINCLFGDFDAKDEVLPDEYAPFLPGDFASLKPKDQETALKEAQVKAMMLDLPKYKARALAKVRLSPLTPTWTNNTGGGYQCYWFLSDTTLVNDGNRERLKALQEAWVELIGADSGAKDLARVLRLPGSANVKAHFAPSFPIVTVEGYDPSRLYTMAEFETLTGIDDAWQRAQAAQAGRSSKPKQTASDSVIDKFNSTNKIVDVLTRNGYKVAQTFKGTTRLIRPGGTSVSVTVWNAANRSLHHSSSDPLHGSAHGWDAYDVFKRLEHNDDYDAAWKAAKKEVGLWDNDLGGAQAAATAALNGNPAYAPPPPHINGAAHTNGNGPAAANNGNGNSKSNAKGPSGLTQAQESAISLFFAMTEWDLLAGVCLKIPGRYGRPYLRAKFLALHQGDNDKADGEIKKYRFAGTPTSEQVENDLVRWGFNFTENELDGTIFANGQPVDEALRAQINLKGRDAGYGVRGSLPLAAIPETILVMARRNRFHTARDWLDGLVWDGKPHLAELITYFKDKHPRIVYPDGTTQSVFGAFLMRWMQGAVRRAHGDTNAQNSVFVLGGPQGIGKSFTPKWLCSGIPELFVEGPIDPNNPDHKRLLVTRFIWEISELPSTMNKADANALKSFLTTGEATFRVPYAKDPITRPALASFFGTLNPTTGHLVDVTGNRRFLSIELESIDKAYSTAIDVAQLWAEAMHYYRQGVSYQLTPAEEQAQKTLNDAARVTNDTGQALLKYYEVDPAQSGWFEFTIDIVEELKAKHPRTDVTKVGTELRGLLGYGSVERRTPLRRGQGFYGVKKR